LNARASAFGEFVPEFAERRRRMTRTTGRSALGSCAPKESSNFDLPNEEGGRADHPSMRA